MAEQKALASPGGLTWARVCKECGQCHESQDSHVYEYQDEVDDELVCHICLQPLLQPVDTPCGHTYCLQCLSSFLREQDFCPVDRQRVALQQCRSASLLVRNLLDKLTVLCPFHNECQQSMQRCELQPHLHNRSVYEVQHASCKHICVIYKKLVIKFTVAVTPLLTIILAQAYMYCTPLFNVTFPSVMASYSYNLVP